MRESTLLELDGFGNILLGLPLVFYPKGVTRLLVISSGEATFYPIILGAVFIGIGIALLVQRYHPSLKGLGLTGAMIINLTFGLALMSWLISKGAEMTSFGNLLLWLLVAVLVGLSLIEWFSLSAKANRTT